MNNKFIKITYIVEGHEFDLIANVNEIVRLSYGFNILEFRTPLNNGSNYLSNQNPIALAECVADDGNGGFYYSVGSLVIGDIHFPFVEA